VTSLALRTVASFGDEWQRIDQQGMGPDEVERVFGDYFAIFRCDHLPPRCFRLLWRLSSAARLPIRRLPPRLYYHHSILHTPRTAARDRFGTPPGATLQRR
jgi:hypothetical protein